MTGSFSFFSFLSSSSNDWIFFSLSASSCFSIVSCALVGSSFSRSLISFLLRFFNSSSFLSSTGSVISSRVHLFSPTGPLCPKVNLLHFLHLLTILESLFPSSEIISSSLTSASSSSSSPLHSESLKTFITLSLPTTAAGLLMSWESPWLLMVAAAGSLGLSEGSAKLGLALP